MFPADVSRPSVACFSVPEQPKVPLLQNLNPPRHSRFQCHTCSWENKVCFANVNKPQSCFPNSLCGHTSGLRAENLFVFPLKMFKNGSQSYTLFCQWRLPPLPFFTLKETMLATPQKPHYKPEHSSDSRLIKTQDRPKESTQRMTTGIKRGGWRGQIPWAQSTTTNRERLKWVAFKCRKVVPGLCSIDNLSPQIITLVCDTDTMRHEQVFFQVEKRKWEQKTLYVMTSWLKDGRHKECE